MIRLGIAGTGRIANRFMSDLHYVENIGVVMVYNPRLEGAKEFADKYTIPGCTHDINELAAAVDAVYIASPHEYHYSAAKQMLSRGKHVLCEKPLALVKKEAEELFDLAKANGVVLMEAVKTAYCPGFLKLIEAAQSGIIGEIRDVEACFTRLTPTNTRELTNLSYGGSFTELGSYILLPALKLLGTDVINTEFRSLYEKNGLDIYTKAFLEYDGKMAMGKAGLGIKSEGQLVVSGTKGYILAPSPWWLTKRFEVRFEDPGLCKEYNFSYEGHGLHYELAAFAHAVRKGGIPEGLREDESIAMADIMEQFLKRNPEKPIDMDRMDQLKIWAHRGCSRLYPENTLSAFGAAADIPGITGIELDVQLTADGEVVVIHDESVDRTTDGRGEVRDLTLKEIKELKISNGTETYERIPLLEEVFVLLKPYCLEDGLQINIELKNSVYPYEGMEEKVLALVRNYGLEPYIFYSSFLPESLARLKKLDKSVRTGVLAGSLEDCILCAGQTGADALHPPVSGLYGKIPPEMKDMAVRVWNTTEPLYGKAGTGTTGDLRNFAAYGATDLITNEPERYLE